MPHEAFGSRFRDGTRGRLLERGLYRVVSKSGIAQPVVAPMYASECRRYAEQCLRLAQELAPQHRDLLFALADEWRKAARDLEELDAHEDRSLQQ